MPNPAAIEEKSALAAGDGSAGMADPPSRTDHQASSVPSRQQLPTFLADMSKQDREVLERRLKRKIDLRLMPPIVIMYILNYIDRTNITTASLAGLERDLRLSSVEFQTAVSIFFVGYVLMQVPSNLLMNKTGKPAIYLPTFMILWGAISAATAGCTSAAGLCAVRFFLGFVEAAYYPGCLYYLSCWYRRDELSLRSAILFSGSLISGAFSGLISAGVTYGMDGARGLGAWQWLFIIEGAATVAVAFAAFFVLPNFPRTTSWLTEEERRLAVWRLEEDIGEDDWIDSEHQGFWVGAKLAFSDTKTYMLMVLIFGTLSAATVTNFFPKVVDTLGYGRVTSLLLTSPPYVLAIITTMINAIHADRTRERFWHVAIPLCFSVAAFIIAATTSRLGPRYFSMVLMVPAIYTSYVVALGWISNILPRPPAKRAAALALINAFGNCSGIYASYMYPDSAAPQYTLAMSVNSCMSLSAICAATALRFMLVRLNKKLDAGIRVEGVPSPELGEVATRGFRFRV